MHTRAETEVVGADQVTRRNVEPGHTRLLFTLFGTVTVARMAYRAISASHLYPLDAGLNLPAERSGHGLRKLAEMHHLVELVRGCHRDHLRGGDAGYLPVGGGLWHPVAGGPGSAGLMVRPGRGCPLSVPGSVLPGHRRPAKC